MQWTEDEFDEVITEARYCVEWETGAPMTGVEHVMACERMRVLAAELLHDSVDVARATGATWQQIGDALGISRQAAHERFSTRL